MHHGTCGIEQGTSTRRRAAAVAAGLLVAMVMAASAVAKTVTPSIWVELEEMRPPCTSDVCTREVRAPGVVMVGTGFVADLPVQMRFVSLDGTRPSMLYKTEPSTAGGDITLLTGERVCNDWLGSPLEASGLPEEHAWEVRAAPLTPKSGVAAIGSNILYGLHLQRRRKRVVHQFGAAYSAQAAPATGKRTACWRDQYGGSHNKGVSQCSPIAARP